MNQTLNDICVKDYFGEYVDAMWNIPTQTWTVKYMGGKTTGLSRKQAEIHVEQILLASKIIQEIIWDEEIGDMRKFE